MASIPGDLATASNSSVTAATSTNVAVVDALASLPEKTVVSVLTAEDNGATLVSPATLGALLIDASPSSLQQIAASLVSPEQDSGPAALVAALCALTPSFLGSLLSETTGPTALLATCLIASGQSAALEAALASLSPAVLAAILLQAAGDGFSPDPLSDPVAGIGTAVLAAMPPASAVQTLVVMKSASIVEGYVARLLLAKGPRFCIDLVVQGKPLVAASGLFVLLECTGNATWQQLQLILRQIQIHR